MARKGSKARKKARVRKAEKKQRKEKKVNELLVEGGSVQFSNTGVITSMHTPNHYLTQDGKRLEVGDIVHHRSPIRLHELEFEATFTATLEIN
jgi:hypothetical protein